MTRLAPHARGALAIRVVDPDELGRLRDYGVTEQERYRCAPRRPTRERLALELDAIGGTALDFDIDAGTHRASDPCEEVVMPQVRKSIEIKAPVGEVFTYMTTPENLPEIWPSMLEVSNVARKPDGSHSFDWVYKLLGIRFHGHAETIQLEPNRLSVVKNEKGIKSTFRWSFQGRDDTTQVTSEVDYEIPGALLGKFAAPLIQKLNEREAEHVLENLKMRMELGARGARPEPQPHA